MAETEKPWYKVEFFLHSDEEMPLSSSLEWVRWFRSDSVKYLDDLRIEPVETPTQTIYAEVPVP